MRTKIRKLRTKLSKNNSYDKELIKKIENIPIYDLFTPSKVAILCEEEEINNPIKMRFLEHKNFRNFDVVLFLLVLPDKYNIYEKNPVRGHIRYDIDDPEIPHFPGKEFEMNIHNSEVIENIENLDKYNINKNKINLCEENHFPALKLRSKMSQK